MLKKSVQCFIVHKNLIAKCKEQHSTTHLLQNSHAFPCSFTMKWADHEALRNYSYVINIKLQLAQTNESVLSAPMSKGVWVPNPMLGIRTHARLLNHEAQGYIYIPHANEMFLGARGVVKVWPFLYSIQYAPTSSNPVNMTELGCINQELSDFYCNPILPRVVSPWVVFSYKQILLKT